MGRIRSAVKWTGKRLSDGVVYLYDRYPWLGSLDGKKRLLALYTLAIEAGIGYMPQLAPLLEGTRDYALPVATAISLFMTLWGATHAHYKKTTATRAEKVELEKAEKVLEVAPLVEPDKPSTGGQDV